MCFEEQFGTITAADIKEEKSYLLVSLSTYNFAEKYGGGKCGLTVTEEQLQVVAELSNVLEGTDDFLSNSFRQECKCHIENVDDVNHQKQLWHVCILKQILI